MKRVIQKQKKAKWEVGNEDNDADANEETV